MAKIYKLTKGGQTIYPATTTDTVVNPNSRKSLTEELSELDYKIISSDSLLKKASIGKNLLNPSFLLEGKKVDSNGIITPSSALAVSLFIPIQNGQALTASSSDGFFQCNACLYDDDFNPILSSLVTGTGSNDKDMTLTNDSYNASYAAFTFRLPSELSQNMVESGNNATDYVPYTDNYENEETFKTIGNRLDELTGKEITSVIFEPGRVSNTTGIASGAGRHYKISCKGYARITARIYRSSFGGATGVGYAFMDASGKFISGGSNTEAQSDFSTITIDVPADAVEFRNTYASSGELQEPVILLSAIDSKLEETNENIERLSNNLVKIEDSIPVIGEKDITSVSFEPGRVSNTTGIASGAGRHYKISCKGYARITARIYRSSFGGATGVGYAFMDASGKFISGGSNTEAQSDFSTITIDVPADAVEFRNTYASSGELQEPVILSDLISYEVKVLTEQVESFSEVKAETKDLLNTRLGLIRDGCKPLKIFFLGNSFSVQSSNYFVKLCKANGINVTVGISYIGGATLQGYDQYYGNTETDYYKYIKGEWVSHQDIIGSSYKKKNIEKLQDEDWDIIFMQQGSDAADAYNTYQPYGKNVYDWCKKNAQISFVEMRWLMPWAWSDKRLVSNTTSGGATTNAQMYEGIANATRQMLEDLGYKLSPNGTAIQNLYPQYTQNDIFSSSGDGQHLNGDIALFTVGYCLFRTIIPYYYPDVNMDLVYTDEKISADMFASAKQAVENAISNPYVQTSIVE